MKTWNDYKEYVRTVDPETAKDIKETEEVAAISLPWLSSGMLLA